MRIGQAPHVALAQQCREQTWANQPPLRVLNQVAYSTMGAFRAIWTKQRKKDSTKHRNNINHCHCETNLAWYLSHARSFEPYLISCRDPARLVELLLHSDTARMSKTEWNNCHCHLQILQYYNASWKKLLKCWTEWPMEFVCQVLPHGFNLILGPV